MKKVGTILFFMTMVFTLFAGENLVLNPGFENWTAGQPDNWTYESGVTLEQNSDTVYEGSYSAKVTLTTQTQSNTDTYADTIAVTPGHTYEYKFMVYDNDPAGSVRLVITWYDASGAYIANYYGGYSSDGTDWEELGYIWTAPSDAYYVTAQFRFYDNSTEWDGDAVFYIDAVSFEDTASSNANSAPSITNITRIPTAVEPSVNVYISADITDDSNILADTLFYNVNGGSWVSINNDSISGTTYYYTLGSFSLNDSVSYYIKAVDDSSAITTSDEEYFIVQNIPAIKINEIGYDALGTDPYTEWVELYNPEDYDADISGWILTDDPSSDGGDEGMVIIPSGTAVPAKGYFVLMCDADSFFTYYSLPAGVDYYAHGVTSLSMSNTGDDIHLFDSYGSEIDAAWYESGGDIGSVNAAPSCVTGGSIGRSPNGADTDNCSVDFFAYGTADITPGAPNANTPPVIDSVYRTTIVPNANTAETVNAEVHDDYGLTNVYLRYYLEGTLTDSILMTATKAGYTASIPGQSDGVLVEYDVVAYDDSSASTISDKDGYFAGITPIGKIDVNDSNGFPLYYGYGVRVDGIATVPQGVFNTAATIINIQDKDNYNAIVARTEDIVSIDIGDSVRMEGTIGINTGQLRISDPGAVLQVLQTDVGMPSPVILRAENLRDTLGEEYDGTFAVLYADTIQNGTWPASGSSALLSVYDTTEMQTGDLIDTFLIWIDNDTDIDDNSEPTWNFYVAGVISQYDLDSPYFDNYELMPRQYTDFNYDLSLTQISFSALVNENAILLNWHYSGTDISYFEIERKFTNEYEKIATIPVNTSGEYSYEDNVEINGTIYYKLIAVHNDGTKTISGPMKVSNILGTNVFRLYIPTFTTNNNFVLRIYSPSNNENVKVKIMDITGRTVFDKSISVNAGISYRTLNLELSSGIYLVSVNNGEQELIRKFIVK